MDYEERLVPVAAEAGPREELTNEKETRIDQRISKVGDSLLIGLAAESVCNPEERNRLALAVES